MSLTCKKTKNKNLERAPVAFQSKCECLSPILDVLREGPNLLWQPSPTTPLHGLLLSPEALLPECSFLVHQGGVF